MATEPGEADRERSILYLSFRSWGIIIIIIVATVQVSRCLGISGCIIERPLSVDKVEAHIKVVRVAHQFCPRILHMLLCILVREAQDTGKESERVRLYGFHDRHLANATDFFVAAVLGPATNRTLKVGQYAKQNNSRKDSDTIPYKYHR